MEKMEKMEKFASISSFCEFNHMSKSDIRDMALRASLELLANCARNFDGEPTATEEVAEPLYILVELIDKVE